MSRQLLASVILVLALPAWGQTGPAIAYEAHTASAIKLMVMNSDGSNKRVVLSRGRNRTPNWSPDAQKLVFASDLQGAGIYLINVEGTGLCKLVAVNDAKELFAGPVWSPAILGGNYWIIYADFPNTAAPNRDLFAIKASCATPGLRVQLTNTGNSNEWFPSWSHLGNKLAAQVDAGTGPFIMTYTVALANNVPQLSNSTSLQSLFGGRYSAEPDWGKTDDRLSLEANFPIGEVGDVWITDMTSSGTYNLTKTSSAHETRPSWSSDDSEIVYRSQPFSNGQLGRQIGLYKRNLFTGTVTLLAGTDVHVGDLHFPDWRR